MPKVLITGGCGFIGANLAQRLVDKGYDVTVLDNFSRGSKQFLADNVSLNVVECDVRDYDGLLNAIVGHDTIIHLAALGSVVDSVGAPSENFSVNVEGTFKVLSAARDAEIKQVIFSSTGGALIGNALPPVDENSVARPISPYGASKLAGEGYCCAFAHSYGMSITALRFANVVGPISWHKKGAVTAFFKAVLDGRPLEIYGDGSATRDFLFVDDLCDGINAALDAALPGYNVIHLASGNELSIRDLAKLTLEAAQQPDHPVEYREKRTGEVERNFASCELARELLGFSAKVEITEALDATWRWFKSYQAP